MDLTFDDEIISLQEMMRSIYRNGYKKGESDARMNISGEVCPKCKSKRFRVTDSRVKKNMRRRRKQCEICGERWATVETLVINYD